MTKTGWLFSQLCVFTSWAPGYSISQPPLLLAAPMWLRSRLRWWTEWYPPFSGWPIKPSLMQWVFCFSHAESEVPLRRPDLWVRNSWEKPVESLTEMCLPRHWRMRKNQGQIHKDHWHLTSETIPRNWRHILRRKKEKKISVTCSWKLRKESFQEAGTNSDTVTTSSIKWGKKNVCQILQCQGLWQHLPASGGGRKKGGLGEHRVQSSRVWGLNEKAEV